MNNKLLYGMLIIFLIYYILKNNVIEHIEDNFDERCKAKFSDVVKTVNKLNEYGYLCKDQTGELYICNKDEMKKKFNCNISSNGYSNNTNNTQLNENSYNKNNIQLNDNIYYQKNIPLNENSYSKNNIQLNENSYNTNTKNLPNEKSTELDVLEKSLYNNNNYDKNVSDNSIRYYTWYHIKNTEKNLYINSCGKNDYIGSNENGCLSNKNEKNIVQKKEKGLDSYFMFIPIILSESFLQEINNKKPIKYEDPFFILCMKPKLQAMTACGFNKNFYCSNIYESLNVSTLPIKNNRINFSMWNFYSKNKDSKDIVKIGDKLTFIDKTYNGMIFDCGSAVYNKKIGDKLYFLSDKKCGENIGIRQIPSYIIDNDYKWTIEKASKY